MTRVQAWRQQESSRQLECARAAAHPGHWCHAAGLLSILFLTPLWGFLALAIPFYPPEFALGLAVMACVPTSLSSGVTLVRASGPGHSARRGWSTLI